MDPFIQAVLKAEKHGWKVMNYRAWGATLALYGEYSAAECIAVYYDGHIEIIK